MAFWATVDADWYNRVCIALVAFNQEDDTHIPRTPPSLGYTFCFTHSFLCAQVQKFVGVGVALLAVPEIMVAVW